MNIKDLQMSALHILQATTKFLESNGLNYSISYGTLLGAVRHGGFIPWDDDVDITMPRPDYECLQTILQQKGNHLTSSMYFHSYEQKNLNLPFTKVYDYSIRTKDNRYADKYEKYLWVDIFPVDGMSESIEEAERTPDKIKFYKKLIATKKKTLRSVKSPIAKVRKFFQKLVLLPVSSRFLAGRMVKIAKRYPYVASDSAGMVVWGDGPREHMPKQIFERYTNIKFENLKFKCYKDYRVYLTNLYGYYKKLPPKSQRITHHIKAWRVDYEK